MLVELACGLELLLTRGYVVMLTSRLSPQISMGQNQDKMDGGEQALAEGPEEARPNSSSGGGGNHIGDVMEGGSSQEEEEEAGNTEENSREPDALNLEPATPSREESLWVRPVAAREVRQGGAAEKKVEVGGAGGRATPQALQETEKNQKSSSRVEGRTGAFKLYNLTKREERRTGEELNTSSKTKMDDTIPQVEIQEEDFQTGVVDGKNELAFTSKDENSLSSAEEDLATVRMSRRATGAGRDSKLPVQPDQRDAIVADIADGDMKLCAGTVDRLIERKEPPTARALHPFKNSLQNESLSDMSDTIHCGPPNERTENNTKGERLMCEVKAVFNDFSPMRPKVTDTDEQRESVRPCVQTDIAKETTNQVTGSDPAPNVASPTEPSFILEKLLQRNKKQTTPADSDIQEVRAGERDIGDDVTKRTCDSAVAGLCPESINQSVGLNTPSSAKAMKDSKDNSRKEKLTAKDHDIKGPDLNLMDSDVTSDAPCFPPGALGNVKCERPIAATHLAAVDCERPKNTIPTDASVKEETQLKPNVSSTTKPSFDNLQSAVSYRKKPHHVDGVIDKTPVPSLMSDPKSPPSKGDAQTVDSHHAAPNKDTSVTKPPLTDSVARTGSTCSDDQSLGKMKVKNPVEDTAPLAMDAGSVSVQGDTSVSEEHNKAAAEVKQDVQSTHNVEHLVSDQHAKTTGKEADDSIRMRDKSQDRPKSRPVSELIKETIQLHEKLQHPERPKPAEIKPDEQGQSVKVAQMKAAFDSAQKSPDKSVERKPSVRKGKGRIWLDCISWMDDT